MTPSLKKNDNKKIADLESAIRSGKAIGEAELRQWLILKFLKTLDMLVENRDISLCAHAASEKESAGNGSSAGSGPSASLMKEANQAVKLYLDALEKLRELCKIAESSGGPSANEASAAKQTEIEALKRKIRDNMRGIGNNDTQTELW